MFTFSQLDHEINTINTAGVDYRAKQQNTNNLKMCWKCCVDHRLYVRNLYLKQLQHSTHRVATDIFVPNPNFVTMQNGDAKQIHAHT